MYLSPNKPVLLAAVLVIVGCSFLSCQKEKSPVHVVAFMPDIHFHDIFGQFEKGALDGLPAIYEGDTLNATIRTMESQLRSTRLFNENYFALLAALDEAAERDIKLISLPGDFSDDGQPVHIRGLKKILNHYEGEHGMRFFLAPGNHDPNRPMDQPAGKENFLGKGGREQPVFSTNHPLCENKPMFKSSNGKQPHPVICTDGVLEYGYQSLLRELDKFGFYPDSDDTYFETPYSSYHYDDYILEKGLRAAAYDQRVYEICREGTGGAFKKEFYTRCSNVGDLSYLAEPVDGLWLLSIDANVYLPGNNMDENFDSNNPRHFEGSGNAGYNRMLTHKEHLIEWIADIAQRADKLGKTLVTFSHFPMAEFYDDSYDLIGEVFGTDNALQQQRMPIPHTSQALAKTGIKIHVGGHMHMNDTGIILDEETGMKLFNIQAPSLAAYKPAFKILSFFEDQTVEVETVILQDVPNFDTLFPLYESEWTYLDSINYKSIWNRDILESKTYADFTNWHIAELSRLRFYPEHWPENLPQIFPEITAREMIAIMLAAEETDDLPIEKLIQENKYLESADKMIQLQGYDPKTFDWNGEDLILDFHRLMNAGELALGDIGAIKLSQFKMMASLTDQDPFSRSSDSAQLANQLASIFQILGNFIEEEPSMHFYLDLSGNPSLHKSDPE